MTIVKHELKQGMLAFWIWTISIAFLMMVCIFLFPQMKDQMQDVTNVFADMGSFTAAFGMDTLNFGTLIGFYGIECGNILGLGGAFFASFMAVSMISKEEKDHTAEFLCTHPISRSRIFVEKFVAVLIQIIVLNLLIYGLSIVSIYLIGEDIPFKEINLLHIGYFIMQLEFACICFGISAFISRNSIGIGLGLAIMMYFVNIIANITDKVDFLKYITPFGYCEASEIVQEVALNFTYIGIGTIVSTVCILLGFMYYRKKDIKA
ncbi:MAG: ABC transporter permease subunit [Floccifex sp.]